MQPTTPGGARPMQTAAPRKIKIGPSDHGRKMSLKAFELARTEDGYHYELSRGFITVSNGPSFVHARVVGFMRSLLGVYEIAHPEAIQMVLDNLECKLL